jgi:hypothetical protein
MLSLLLIASFSVANVDGPTIGPEQFLSLIRSFHSKYRDVSFLYEGGFRYVGPSNMIDVDPASVGYDFQGTYIFRADGAVRQELYRRGLAGDHIIIRNDLAMLNGKGQKQSVSADFKDPGGPPKEFDGIPAMFFMTGSAKRMFFSWFFDALTDPAEQGYEFLGWQDLDGHACLCVQLNSVPGSKKADYYHYRFWIDMERGGHPLRVEMVAGAAVRLRVDRIRIDRLVPQRGEETWMPTTATVETFLWGDKDYSYPFFKETYGMINGSFKFNQGYGDEKFTLKGKQKPLGDNSLQSFRGEFEHTPHFRTDPEGVQITLNKLLKEADDMSLQLDAGSPGGPFWDNPFALSFGFIALGVCILVGAGFWKRRFR